MLGAAEEVGGEGEPVRHAVGDDGERAHEVAHAGAPGLPKRGDAGRGGIEEGLPEIDALEVFGQRREGERIAAAGGDLADGGLPFAP